MNWSGPIELSGSRTYNEVPHDLLFELTCKNSAGDATFATASITIKSEGVSNETTNWNTYRSEEYGFEIKYPNALQTEEYHYSLEKVTAFPPVRFKDERGNLVEGTIRLGTLGDPRRDPAVDDGGNRIDFEKRTRNIILSLAAEGLMGSPNLTLIEYKKIVDNHTVLGYLSVI